MPTTTPAQAMGTTSKYADERAELLNKLKSTPGGLDGDLALSLRQGVAFHHAGNLPILYLHLYSPPPPHTHTHTHTPGLTTEERECLEDAFHNGVVSVCMYVCMYV